MREAERYKPENCVDYDRVQVISEQKYAIPVDRTGFINAINLRNCV